MSLAWRPQLLHGVRLCVLATVLAGSPAAAEPPAALTSARDAYRRGNFLLAMEQVRTARQSPQATRSDVVECLWLEAMCQFALGHKPEADAVFDVLLEIEPLYEPPRALAPPDARAALAQRAQRYQQAHGVTLGQPTLDGPRLSVTLEGELARVDAVVFYVRPKDGLTFLQHRVALDGANASVVLEQGDVLADATRRGGMELVVEAFNRAGGAVGRLGNAQTPLVLQVAAPAATAASNTPTPQQPPAAAGNPWAARALWGVGALSGVAAVLGLLGGVAAAAAGVGAFYVAGFVRGSDHYRSPLLVTYGVGVAAAAVGALVLAVCTVVAVASLATGTWFFVAGGVSP